MSNHCSDRGFCHWHNLVFKFATSKTGWLLPNQSWKDIQKIEDIIDDTYDLLTFDEKAIIRRESDASEKP